MSMKIQIQILLVFTTTVLAAQPKLDYNDFLTIKGLYKAGKYQVIANHLSENGFKLEYFNEDYSIGSPNIITKGEMKFSKEEQMYICDYGNVPFKTGTLTSIITFTTKDYPDELEYEINFELYDGDCIRDPKDWPHGRHYGSGILRDKFARPLIETYKLNKSFELQENNFDSGGTTFLWDTTTVNYKTTSGEIRSTTKTKRLSVRDRGVSSLKIWYRENAYKYPIEIPLEQYYKLNSVGTSLTKIQLEKMGGVYYLEVTISGKRQKYILDSGASEVAISESMEKYLHGIGALRKEDYLPNETFKLADGSSTIHRRVLLPSVGIGDITLNRVPAYITKDSSPLLFGKSALDMFAYWKIDNATNKLEVKSK
jgi:clan AA aspartic protease (TIGR02281 family)